MKAATFTVPTTCNDINERLAIISPIYHASGNASTGWKELFALQQAKADLLRPLLGNPRKHIDEQGEYQVISAFNVGDILAYHDVLIKVDEISVHPGTNNELPVYVLSCTYIAGSLDFFHQYTNAINNGTGRGYRLHVQSNDHKKWFNITQH
jgi:hypothetical protein